MKNKVLQKYVLLVKIKELSLVLDCKTRWNSMFEMIEWYMSEKAHIKDLLHLSIEHNIPTAEFLFLNTLSATNKNEKFPISPKKWVPTNAVEMRKFLGLIMYMGLCRFGEIRDYWRSCELYTQNLAPKTMSRNRFQILLRSLHFEDNSNWTKMINWGKSLPF